MIRCLELAKLGIRDVAPNPMVGSVIVHDNTIIGEGYHRKYGGPHAEVNAINSVKNKKLLSESTIYVSLEPCSHFGKTPPCSDLIIAEKIPNVVIGTIDPNTLIAGKGIKKLKKAGINVKVGILETECTELNKRFFTYHMYQRPFITLKWAQTQDGFIDIIRNGDNYGEATWISNSISKILVHKTRSEENAILVGKTTALKDNPSLTTREWAGNNPTRLVIDKNLNLPKTLNLFNNQAPTIVFNVQETKEEKNIHYLKIDFSEEIAPQILTVLFNLEIQSLIIEGGTKTLQQFIDLKLWDEAHVYTGPIFFNSGIQAPKLPEKPICYEMLDEVRLSIFKK